MQAKTHLHVLEVPDNLPLRPHNQAPLVGDELSLKPAVHAQETGELELALHSESLGHHRLWFLDDGRESGGWGAASHVGIVGMVYVPRDFAEKKERLYYLVQILALEE